MSTVRASGHVTTSAACRLRSEVQCVLSFQHLGPGDETLVVRLGDKSFYPLSHFGVPDHFSASCEWNRDLFFSKSCVEYVSWNTSVPAN